MVPHRCALAEVPLVSVRMTWTAGLGGIRCQVPSQMLQDVPEGPCGMWNSGAGIWGLSQLLRVTGQLAIRTTHPHGSGPLWKPGLALTASLGAAASPLGEEKLPQC